MPSRVSRGCGLHGRNVPFGAAQGGAELFRTVGTYALAVTELRSANLDSKRANSRNISRCASSPRSAPVRQRPEATSTRVSTSSPKVRPDGKRRARSFGGARTPPVAAAPRSRVDRARGNRARNRFVRGSPSQTRGSAGGRARVSPGSERPRAASRRHLAPGCDGARTPSSNSTRHRARATRLDADRRSLPASVHAPRRKRKNKRVSVSFVLA